MKKKEKTSSKRLAKDQHVFFERQNHEHAATSAVFKSDNRKIFDVFTLKRRPWTRTPFLVTKIVNQLRFWRQNFLRAHLRVHLPV